MASAEDLEFLGPGWMVSLVGELRSPQSYLFFFFLVGLGRDSRGDGINLIDFLYAHTIFPVPYACPVNDGTRSQRKRKEDLHIRATIT